jgi:hypothetical protein
MGPVTCARFWMKSAMGSRSCRADRLVIGFLVSNGVTVAQGDRPISVHAVMDWYRFVSTITR